MDVFLGDKVAILFDLCSDGISLPSIQNELPQMWWQSDISHLKMLFSDAFSVCNVFKYSKISLFQGTDKEERSKLCQSRQISDQWKSFI